MKKLIVIAISVLIPVMVIASDMRVQYTDKLCGANSPVCTDTLNRLPLVEHNNDGTHKDIHANSIQSSGTSTFNVASIQSLGGFND